MEWGVIEETVKVVDWIATPCDVIALRHTHRFFATGSAFRARSAEMRTRRIFVMSGQPDSCFVGLELRLGGRALFDKILCVSLAVAA